MPKFSQGVLACWRDQRVERIGEQHSDRIIRQRMRHHLRVTLGRAHSLQDLVGFLSELRVFGIDLGDFNGDGQSDLLWRNTTTGQTAIWFLNGVQVSSTAGVATVGTDWVIQNVNAN
jgi:hypothetical protein